MITEKSLRTCNAIHEVEEFVNCALFSKDYDSISPKMSNLALYERNDNVQELKKGIQKIGSFLIAR